MAEEFKRLSLKAMHIVHTQCFKPKPTYSLVKMNNDLATQQPILPSVLMPSSEPTVSDSNRTIDAGNNLCQLKTYNLDKDSSLVAVLTSESSKVSSSPTDSSKPSLTCSNRSIDVSNYYRQLKTHNLNKDSNKSTRNYQSNDPNSLQHHRLNSNHMNKDSGPASQQVIWYDKSFDLLMHNTLAPSSFANNLNDNAVSQCFSKTIKVSSSSGQVTPKAK